MNMEKVKEMIQRGADIAGSDPEFVSALRSGLDMLSGKTLDKEEDPGYKDLEEFIWNVAKQNWELLRLLPAKYMPPKMAMDLVKESGNYLEVIPKERRAKDVCIQALKTCPWQLKSVPEDLITYELCWDIVGRYGSGIRFVPEHLVDEKLCLRAIEQDSYAWLHCKHFSPAVDRLVVKKDGHFLRDMEDQTEGMCLLAVRQRWTYLEYAKVQTFDVCAEAINQSVEALKYVKDQTFHVCRYALGIDLKACQYIREPSEEVKDLVSKLKRT